MQVMTATMARPPVLSPTSSSKKAGNRGRQAGPVEDDPGQYEKGDGQKGKGGDARGKIDPQHFDSQVELIDRHHAGHTQGGADGNPEDHQDQEHRTDEEDFHQATSSSRAARRDRACRG
jgi:hypothetical protein